MFIHHTVWYTMFSLISCWVGGKRRGSSDLLNVFAVYGLSQTQAAVCPFINLKCFFCIARKEVPLSKDGLKTVITENSH